MAIAAPVLAAPLSVADQQPLAGTSLVDIAGVCQRLAMCRASVYRLVASGELARPAPIGRRGVRWLSSDLDAYVARVAARRAAA